MAALPLLVTCASHVAYAQDRVPELLRQASHCLIADRRGWLAGDSSNAKSLTLGYVIDTKSDPGSNHIYVVVYTNPQHSKGRVFDLLYERRGSVTSLDIQNNASFVESRGSVTFVDPSLGGTWTQTHLQSAIKQAGRKPAITLNLVDLSAPFSGVSCKTYVGSE